ncbi:nicotinate (nicotinamide) nucleotide adenylyltransferase [Fodinibius salsisoli]|uniref:Probable nicotinate-nucleotide adenylyltransferase n=1 Tax=Fodinibius salsisoli TaxID=2820877 RepID=A0ABT3PKM7_9BACT|nr:nicotinate (nicotinamide) nucleotide adenylyltransferase [Fodinibius salsisoli]MCW9706313.1 nicotinate (nicotinamide) nucleotide adenylyltransferase [Fodinibius salsisoli]
MVVQDKAVGLLGGSFDPVHLGHLSIAKSFLESDGISELWVLLTPAAPHKEGQQLTSYELRMEMLHRTFDEIKGIKVTDIESRLSPPYYTVRTLRYLTRQYPDQPFFWCIGEDSLADFESWHKWQEILDLCNLLVARRPASETGALNAKIKNHAYFVDHQPVDISSTQIRSLVQEGKSISNFVPPSVAEFIAQHKLYQE